LNVKTPAYRQGFLFETLRSDEARQETAALQKSTIGHTRIFKWAEETHKTAAKSLHDAAFRQCLMTEAYATKSCPIR